jgi:hypothetical protein
MQITPNWSQLRPVGNSLPVKISVVAPFVGNYLILNPLFGSFWNDGLQVDGNIQSSLRLYIFYFGLTFLGFGSIIFQVFCPVYIKKFAEEETFIADLERTSTGPSLKAQYNTFRQAETTYAATISETSRLRFDSPEADFLSQKTDLLRSFFRTYDKSMPRGRFVCAFLFFTGMIILSIPSVWTLALIVRRIFGF